MAMLTKKVVCLILGVGLLAALGLSPAAEDAAKAKTKLLVTPAKGKSKDAKVSPGLDALAACQGTFLGQTGKGQFIIAVPKKDAERAKRELAKQGAKAVEAATAAGGRPARTRNLLVKYKPDGKEAARKALESQGYQILEDYKPGSFFRVGSGKGQFEASAVTALSKLPSVSRIQIDRVLSVPTPRPKPKQDFKLSAMETPNDLFWKELWGMRAINAPKAWNNGWKRSKNGVVAVIDTGIDYQHEDLKESRWLNPTPDPDKNDLFGYDFLHNTGDPMDDNEHGTHCAGTIAAVGNNMKGVVGVSWEGKLMALKFLDSTGSGVNSHAIKCIDYAIEHGARVISASWGGESNDPLLFEAIARAKDKKVVFVAAAGNDGNNNDQEQEREYPCSYDLDNIISVMAVDKEDKVPEWSGFGKTRVHIAAPGVGILSCQPSDHYQKLDGTSMATPHVAGAVALLLSQPKYADMEPKAIRQLLMDKARRVDGVKCASGVLDLSFLADETPPKE
jgi:thermitase